MAVSSSRKSSGGCPQWGHTRDDVRASALEQTAEPGDNHALRPDGSNLAAFLLAQEVAASGAYRRTQLAVLVRSAAEKTRVILATQLATLLDQFEPGDVIVTEHRRDESVFRRLDEAGLDGWGRVAQERPGREAVTIDLCPKG